MVSATPQKNIRHQKTLPTAPRSCIAPCCYSTSASTLDLKCWGWVLLPQHKLLTSDTDHIRLAYSDLEKAGLHIWSLTLCRGFRAVPSCESRAIVNSQATT